VIEQVRLCPLHFTDLKRQRQSQSEIRLHKQEAHFDLKTVLVCF
jgi:hypothetical protein